MVECLRHHHPCGGEHTGRRDAAGAASSGGARLLASHDIPYNRTIHAVLGEASVDVVLPPSSPENGNAKGTKPVTLQSVRMRAAMRSWCVSRM